MATSKEQATITYNSDRFLKKTLNNLVERKVIEWWFYINHLPDEDGKTKHIHLWIKPRKPIDMVEIEKEFYQYEKGKKEPLRCIGFSYSEIKNAILYFLHDEDFLKCKKKERNVHYKYSQLKTSDKLKLEYYYRAAMEWLHNELMQDSYCEDKLRDGGNLNELAMDGHINSKNAWRMKTFKDILVDKKKEAAVTEYQELSARIMSELDDVHKLRDELRKKSNELNFKLEQIEQEKHKNRTIAEQLSLKLENPF